MDKFYPNLIKVIFIGLCCLPGTIFPQEATFFEGFDNTEIGKLPDGWTWYQNGGQDPLAHWGVSTYGWFGPKVAFSGLEGALEGKVDEDWLITPQITPQTGDFLIFDAAQTYTGIDYGTSYHILISTSTNDPSAFTDTLATFNETEFPVYLETTWYDLAAYANTPIYIAFVHETSSNNGNETDDWYLDNVWVRPVKDAEFYSAEVSWQFSIPIRIGKAASRPMLGFKIRVAGDGGTTNLEKMTLTTSGTSDNLKITKATLYTTYDVSFISSGEDTVNADVYGSVINPSDTFDVFGNQELAVGDNYFWLAYTFDTSDEPQFPYPRADASLEEVLVGGVIHSGIKDTVVISPHVVPDSIPNDYYADAIELTPESGRYGSYNLGGTFEPEHEHLAYCAPGGEQDGSNSVWWHFVAPTEGYISVDLSNTNFNTILLFLDKNSDQLACNNDIDPGLELQSRITDFPVEAGQEIYIRVSGQGLPGDPNAEAGIIDMDFEFRGLVSGIDDWTGGAKLSPPYPNPASGLTHFDVELQHTKDVRIELTDALGRPVGLVFEGRLAGGEKHTLDFDVSGLESGLYLLQVRSGAMLEGVRRVVVNNY